MERDGVGWWSRGEEVKQGEGRAGEQAGNAHTQQTCFARVYIMGCTACDMSHTSRRNHTNDKTTNSLKKKKKGSKLEEFVVSEHEGAILCHCMFFYEETAPALLERGTAGRQRAFWKHSTFDHVSPLTVPPP